MKPHCLNVLAHLSRRQLILTLAALAAPGAAMPRIAAATPRADAIRLHPENPRYFLWRGKATLLVASTEHYGAVLNADFDYVRYLDELRARGLNYTRIFSGVYCEPWGEPFNTLNPPWGRYLAPWARSSTPGYADGGNKFDLTRWDDAYFRRLRHFLSEAGRRGVVVEITLFCNWYDDNQWRLSPLHATNNVKGVGGVGHELVNTLRSGVLLPYQEAMVRKIVHEVNPYDNVFFEICNEPGAEGAWMDHMARLVYDTESALPNRHLIANNFHVTPHLSILNAHYDRDASFVRANYARNIVVGYDETGFDGDSDRPYRRQGWMFLLSGGGLYDNLDWSFSVAHPDGTETAWDKRLGGGSPTLRQQLGVLLAFMNSLDFVHMAPDTSVVRAGASGQVAALVEPGQQYAIYLDGGPQVTLSLALPRGRYRAEWVSTTTGRVEKAETFTHAGGERELASPTFAEDIALRVVSTVPDREPPGVESVTAVGERMVQVRFSERVARDTAAEPGRYTISRGVSVRRASLASDGRTVVLETSPLAQGVRYRLTVRGIADRAAPPNRIRTAVGRVFRYDGWSFYRGVNLGGPALTIEGRLWDAGHSPGVSFSGSRFENQSIALDPPADGSLATMTRSSIWNSRGSNVRLTGLPPGTYRLFLYVWQDNLSQTFDVLVNGVHVQQGYSSGAAGHWSKLGPSVAEPVQGAITVQCTPGDANLSGIEIWRASSPAGERCNEARECGVGPTATWVDPRTGARAAIGELPAAGTHAFTAPEGWPDALLLIEACSRRPRS